jgi:hypothetical protein
MSDAETFLDVFDPPEGMVGHSAALVAMTGAEDFLEAAVQRFSKLFLTSPNPKTRFGSDRKKPGTAGVSPASGNVRARGPRSQGKPLFPRS